MYVGNAPQKLVKLRGERTIQEVSEAVGISASALSMYENGNRNPRDEIKKKLARYYNTTVGDLFFDIESHETRPSQPQAGVPPDREVS